MPKDKKRLSKSAKAALKTLNKSKMLASAKAAQTNAGEEFKSSVVTPRTNSNGDQAAAGQETRLGRLFISFQLFRSLIGFAR